MIAFFGHIALGFALFFSLLQSTLPLLGYIRRQPYLMACARPSALAQFVFITLAYLLLTFAFISNDFSIIYVSENSHPDLPLIYRLTAVFGAHEGSILLWILMLNVWTMIFAFCIYRISFTTTEEKKAALSRASLTLAILGWMSFCFLSFLLFTSNPFLSTAMPARAHDLNPLLQDPGFIIHPPMLYLGYVGFSLAFAMTLAALIAGELNSTWLNLTRRFTLAAFSFLTLGITLGSWWAYRVLGWGGFWFWDPVENASLLPWLSGVALIHVLILAEKRGLAKGWAAVLGLTCFILSLFGTFLVRSGVLISAHTFANDPRRGLFLLLLFSLFITLALIFYIIRIPKIAKENSNSFSWMSREMALLLNSALLFIAMLTVLLGTLYPLILDALHLGKISVGAPYFNLVMLPLTLLVMLGMGLGVLCQWQEKSYVTIGLKALKKLAISFLISMVFLWGITSQLEINALIMMSLSFWIILCVLESSHLLPGMSLAHIGFAIMVMGILLSSLLSTEKFIRMSVGTAQDLGPYQFFFIDTEAIQKANYRGIRATFDVVKNKHHVTYLYPEKRFYPVRDMVMTKVDIQPSIFRDLYVALGDPLTRNEWSVRFYYKPFMRFIWLGGVLMMLGGIFSLIKMFFLSPYKKYEKTLEEKSCLSKQTQ